jgi:hypothetical protein
MTSGTTLAFSLLPGDHGFQVSIPKRTDHIPAEHQGIQEQTLLIIEGQARD